MRRKQREKKTRSGKKSNERDIKIRNIIKETIKKNIAVEYIKVLARKQTEHIPLLNATTNPSYKRDQTHTHEYERESEPLIRWI